MGVVAELGRFAVCAWAPSGFHLAAATYAGAVQASFDAASSLELLAVDVVNARLIPGASVPLPDKVAAIAWGPVSRSHPAGLIAAGLVDGAVRVWDAATLLRPATDAAASDPSRGLLFPASLPAKHEGPVNSLEFNNFVGTLLATGGADGQVLIWDLSAPTPSVHAPGAGDKNEKIVKDQITSVAWNRKVQHILGTGSVSGVVAVWDLKNRKQVISIRNPRGRLRASAVVWHPETPTQVLVACDEDDGPGAQLWDLRNATAPLLTFSHHSPRGVQSASWCPHDPEFILTTSRDGRTSLLSAVTGEAIADLPKSTSWNFDVRWSPRSAGVFLSSSFDGRIAVNSILTANSAVSVSAETANALAESFGPDVGDFQSGLSVQSPRTLVQEREGIRMSQPPKWLRRTAGVSFGFGGRVLTFAAKSGNVVSLASGLERNSSLAEGTATVESVLANASPDDPSSLAKFCLQSAADASGPADRMAWEVLSLQFQTDARRKLLNFLGFQVKPADPGDMTDQVIGILTAPVLAHPVRPESKKSDYDGLEPAVDETAAANGTTSVLANLALDGPAPWDVGGAPDCGDSVLDEVPAPVGQNDLSTSNGKVDSSDRLGSKGGTKLKEYASLEGPALDAYINRAIIVGDFETAVDACFHAKRDANALIIAYAGGSSVWRRAQAEVIASVGASGGANIIGAVAGPKDRLDDFIRSAVEVGNWKEALAVIVTYVQTDDFVAAATALGQRLVERQNHNAALICFICACNTRLITTVWSRGKPASGNNAAALQSRTDRLLILVTKVRITTAAALLANGHADISSINALDDASVSVLFEYGVKLAAHGDIAAASAYLNPLDQNVTGVPGLVADVQAQVGELLSIDQLTANSQYAQPHTQFPQHGMPYGEPQTPYTQNHYSQQQEGYGGYNVPSAAYPQSPVRLTPQHWSNNPASYSQPALPPPPMPASPMKSALNHYVSPQSTSAAGNQYASGYSGGGGYSKTVYPSQNQIPDVPPPTSFGAGGYAKTAYPGQNQIPDVPPPTSYSVITPAVPTLGSGPPLPSTPAPPPFPLEGTTAQSAANRSPIAMMQASSLPPPMSIPSPVPPSSIPSFNPAAGYNAVAPPAAMHPPPPEITGAPPPMPYHSNATPGAGAYLPPSSEVAVAKQRQKPLSSSGTPGGPPQRSLSSSSSLSSMGVEASVPLDKVDVGNVPPDQQVIVRSLRGAFQYALGRNSTMMYKKKMDDVSKKLGRLIGRLNARDVEPPIVQQLIALAQGISKGDYETARQVTAALSKEVDWESNRHWLQALQRLIDAVLTGR